ncbi:MAG: septation protein IspZ [Kangiellaceae bacterium]|nr:septation protein IspZ [Kangiellaceae bacterium]
MTFIKENYPIVGFIAVYLITKNLVLAAAVWSAGSLLQILTSVVTKQPIKKSHIAYFIVGLILLAMAYYFNNENFIKWKTSIMVWAGALVILFRQLFNGKYVIKDLTQANNLIKDTAPIRTLQQVNILWIVFLLLFGLLNIYVAYNYSTDFWFWFKMIGLFVSTMGLFILSLVMLKEHLNMDDQERTDQQQ